MDKQEAISAAKEIVSGSGLDRNLFPEVGKARFAKEKWNDPVFEIGMEYGYLLALITTYKITPEEIWGRK